MPATSTRFQQRVRRLRSLFSFSLIAAVQLMIPSAAADPACKIDPPGWSHQHSQQEVQSYAGLSPEIMPEQRRSAKLSEIKLRRQLKLRSAAER